MWAFKLVDHCCVGRGMVCIMSDLQEMSMGNDAEDVNEWALSEDGVAAPAVEEQQKLDDGTDTE